MYHGFPAQKYNKRNIVHTEVPLTTYSCCVQYTLMYASQPQLPYGGFGYYTYTVQ